MTRARVALGVVAAIGAIAVAAAALTAQSAPGPLAQSMETEDTVPIDVGQTMSFGQIVLVNPTAEVATVRAVTPLNPTAGLEIVALRLVRRGDPALPLTGTALGYPPPDIPAGRIVDPVGVGVRPATAAKPWEEQVEVLIALRAPAPGLYSIPSFKIEYSIGGKAYSDVFQQAIRLCVPATAMTDRGCQQPR